LAILFLLVFVATDVQEVEVGKEEIQTKLWTPQRTRMGRVHSNLDRSNIITVAGHVLISSQPRTKKKKKSGSAFGSRRTSEGS